MAPQPQPLPALATPADPAGVASVVICCYTLDRWRDLEAAVASVTGGGMPAETIIVVDHNEELLARARSAWPNLVVLASDGPPGLSGARNTGVRAAHGRIVAFLDDDAVAEPGWLDHLVAPYADERVIGTGGAAAPAWEQARPRWFPAEFGWVVGCSYRGQPAGIAAVRNPLGCAMSFRREVLLALGGFRSGIGRIGRLPIGGEETELGIRALALVPDSLIVLVPAARVRHRVPRDRATWRYFRSRCYQEGRSKAHIAALVGSGPALAAERHYAVRTLPAGVVRGILDGLRGDPPGFARALAIVAGLAFTATGYLAGRSGLDSLSGGPKTARWAAP